MPYLVIRADVPTVAEEINAGPFHDERHAPEIRRKTARADNYDAAMRMARAFAACGSVRTGRQQVRVIQIGQNTGPGW